MGYIPKYVNEMMEDIDNRQLPSDWNSFLYDIEKNNNIILKMKDMYFCTGCQQYFSSKKDLKIKTQVKCPMCKRNFDVRSYKIRNIDIRDNVMMLEKVIIPGYRKVNETQLVLRLFEIRSKYNPDKLDFEHSTVEYGRMLVNEDYRELRNERISPTMGAWVVNHWRDDNGKWRMYSGYGWHEAVPQGYLYKNNLKQTLKGTDYEHSRLWDAIKEPTKSYYDMKLLLREASHDSFESLVEMKLYKLALTGARYICCKGAFNKIFGIDKTYYEFMKKHDITYEQLEILRNYPTKDIRKVKFLEKYEYVIDDIKEYTTIDNFIKYFRTKRLKDAHLYRDYLGFASQLGLDLKNKRYLFPNKLKTMHDKYEKQVEIMKQQKLLESILKRVKKLEKNTFKDKDFIIFPASSVESLIDESKQQNNCVRTYAEKYANGDCDIYFMRKVDNPKISLVTVEVKDNKVVQKRTKNNEKTNKKQDKFLNIWQKKILEKRAS